MGMLLGELGKRLAERWLSLLVLPGALYLAVAGAALVLGYADALDVRKLVEQITAWARDPSVSTAGGQVVLLAAVLAGSATAGLAAQGLGSLLEHLVLAAGWRAWPPPLRQLAGWRVGVRQRHWRDAHATYHRHLEEAHRVRGSGGERPDPTARHAAHRARTRIAPELPDRPTWCGDRVNAAQIRLDRDHHLDLATVWPYLWLQLSETTRAEIITARQALTRSTVLGGWALLYAVLAAWWWPAAPLAVALALTTRQRTRAATEGFAILLEAAVRLYSGELARHLDITAAGDQPPTPQQIGDLLTRHLHTEPPPPP